MKHFLLEDQSTYQQLKTEMPKSFCDHVYKVALIACSRLKFNTK